MLCHWDDVEPETIASRELDGRRRRLAEAAGAARLGLSRYEMGPGERAMPLHVHGDEEELFVVLSGSGISVEGERAYAVEAGDVILYPADGVPHTIVAGDSGLDVLAFASGSDAQLSWLPRAGAMWVGPHWFPLDDPSPFDLEDAAGPLEIPEPGPRPPTVVALTDLPAEEFRRGDVGRLVRRPGAAAGARRSGLAEIRVDAGQLSDPPHCHSADEELFVVVGGDGTLELTEPDGSSTSSSVRVGHVACRPAGTGVAHAFAAGGDGLSLLAFSTNHPSDMRFYPRSGKLSIPGLNVELQVDRFAGPGDDA